MKKIMFFFTENSKFCLKDILVVLCIVLIYGFISFYKLGNIHSPNTFYRVMNGEEVVFDFSQEQEIIHFKYFNGEVNSKYQVYGSLDGVDYSLIEEVESLGTFTWDDISIHSVCKYIKFVIEDDSSLGEVAFYDSNDSYLDYSSNNSYLSDEKSYIPERLSYMNSSYFDEVYFARTAYEYSQGIQTYEWTHPPLGKIIQAIPILITHNFSPFNYRLMGNIAGILMLVVMYMFGALLFKKRYCSILSSLIMGLDTFHFAQTRMGTVDSHLVLFIMLSVFFMFVFFKNEKTRYLFLSGLFFGLSVSVKWTGFYAGLGLAILYFIYFIKNKKDIIESIVKGSIFFVVIPIALYCLWYFLFPNNLLYTNNLRSIVEEQREMYQYHSTLDDEHFFSSSWYTWPISYKPVWYHQQDIGDGTYEETISGVGNIIIWISGIFAFLYVLSKMVFKKDKNSFYLVVISLSLWLPYILIGRVMFLYHFFSVLPFLFLMIVSFLKDLTERYKIKFLIPTYLIVIFLLFLVYYPVVSGMPISKKYASDLELFDSWYFQN